MSVKLHEEHHSLRPAKKARLELSDLLLDEVPSRDIPASGTIGLFHPATVAFPPFGVFGALQGCTLADAAHLRTCFHALGRDSLLC